MLFDALAAETYRLMRNRLTVFWSVVFVPLMFAVGGVIYHLVNKTQGDSVAAAAGLPVTGAGSPLNLAEFVTFGANQTANGALMTFMLIGAATVYAGDYRWETWRLISARNSRTALILAKVGTMKLLAVAASVAMLIAAFVYFLAQGLVFERPITFALGGAEAGDAALLWLLSFVRLVQYGLIGLLTAVVTRSLLAALFVPWALGFGQSVLGAPPVMMLLKLSPDGWPAQLLMPGLAYDTLKNLVSPGIAQVMSTDAALWPALVSLMLWCAAPVGLALLLFRRQDLSKE
jgi:ABC-2 type transport system permease protein